jgi:hypothetical protein
VSAVPKTITLRVALWVLCLGVPGRGEIVPGENPQVTVLVYNDAHVAETMLAEAEKEATRIFQRAGVSVAWLNCSVQDGSRPKGCDQLNKPSQLVQRIVPRCRIFRDEIFGVAFLSADGTGRYSDVFYDRVEALHADWNVDLDRVLAHVMAHEIGHLLLGSNSHSGTGIMRRHWQGAELRSLGMGNLLFTPDQSQFMRAKLSALARKDVSATAESK